MGVPQGFSSFPVVEPMVVADTESLEASGRAGSTPRPQPCGATRRAFPSMARTAPKGWVDALSLAQIERCPASHAFLSTAGAPSARQREQIGLAAHTLPNVTTVILA